MKISKKTDYALRILLELSINYDICKSGSCLKMKDIAQKHKIPYKFLQQIVLTLKKLGYIKTTQGVKGGICLNKEPSKISLGEIVRDLEGTILPIVCLDKTFIKNCPEENCVFKPIWQEVEKKVNDLISNITFEELANKYISSKERFIYQI